MNIINHLKIVPSSKILFLVSGFLLGIGFVFSWLWWLTIFGVALLIYAATKSASYLESLVFGALALTIKTAWAISWFWTTYPINWIDLNLGRFELLVIGTFWLYVSLVIGLSGGLLGLTLRFVNRYTTLVVFCLAVPVLWLGAEVAGAWSFSFFTYGAGASLGGFFSFGFLGYALAENIYLLQLATWGGVYALTVVGALFGVGVYWLATSIYSPRLVLALMVVLVLGLIGSGWLPLATDSKDKEVYQVAVINTKFGGSDFFELSPEEKYAVQKQAITEAVTASLEKKIDYLILPENSRLLNTNYSPEKNYAFFRFTYGDPEVVVIDAGNEALTPTTNTIRATIYDGKQKHGYAVDKQYLVPQGEFVPKVTEALAETLGFGAAVGKLKNTLAYEPGPLKQTSDWPAHIPGVLFCFASVDPGSVRAMTKERELPFVAHPISHAWFNHPTSLWRQLDNMIKIQAVWNNIAIVSAGNMAEGALYTPEGNKLSPKIISQGEYWSVGLIAVPK